MNYTFTLIKPTDNVSLCYFDNYSINKTHPSLTLGYLLYYYSNKTETLYQCNKAHQQVELIIIFSMEYANKGEYGLLSYSKPMGDYKKIEKCSVGSGRIVLQDYSYNSSVYYFGYPKIKMDFW